MLFSEMSREIRRSHSSWIGGFALGLAIGSRLVLAQATPSAKDSAPEWTWHDTATMTIEGKGWTETESPFDRLPAKAKGVVPDSVWNLSRSSAGVCIRFATDADRISARWTVTSESLAMFHMPATGMSGLDLYVHDGDVWRWIGVGRPRQSPTNEAVLAEGIPAGRHEYLLYLPLYNGTKSLEIGVPVGRELAPPPSRPANRSQPVCVYGTSIVQGGCASRPGMAHTSIVGRHLDRPVLNLGFSGGGRMEPVMADLLAELDVAAYVLDCLPNMTAEMVTERIEPFVRRLREAHPDVPILLVENVSYQQGAFLPASRESYEQKNVALRAAYEHLLADGVKGLTYVPGPPLLGDDGEATVDGTHPTDLGFLRMADHLEPFVERVLR